MTGTDRETMSEGDIIYVEVREGSTTRSVIARAWPDAFQLGHIPRHYQEVASVVDINDVGEVAKALGWEPEA